MIEPTALTSNVLRLESSGREQVSTLARHKGGSDFYTDFMNIVGHTGDVQEKRSVEDVSLEVYEQNDQKAASNEDEPVDKVSVVEQGVDVAADPVENNRKADERRIAGLRDRKKKVSSKEEDDSLRAGLEKVSMKKSFVKVSDLPLHIRGGVKSILRKYSRGDIDKKEAGRSIAALLNSAGIKAKPDKVLGSLQAGMILGGLARRGSLVKEKPGNSKVDANSVIIKSSAGKGGDQGGASISDSAVKMSDDSGLNLQGTVKEKIHTIVKKAGNVEKISSESLDQPVNQAKTDFSLELSQDAFKDTAVPVQGKVRQVSNVLDADRQKVFEHLARNTKVTISQQQTKFSTMIRPEQIGRMDFKMTVKDGKLQGRLIVQNQEALEFFKSSVEELRAVFQKSDVEMGTIDVLLAGRDMNGSGQQQDLSGNSDTGFTGMTGSQVERIFEENVAAGDVTNYLGVENGVNLFI
jgi:hypothetical protein